VGPSRSQLTQLNDGQILSVVEGWEETGDYDISIMTPDSSGTKPAKHELSQQNLSTSEDGALSLWTNHKEYEIGANLKILFKVTKPMFVKIFDVTPDGEITTIFPNSYQPDNYCLPDKTYQLPSFDAPYSIEVTGPSGVDRIKAVASTNRIDSDNNIKTRGTKLTPRWA